MASRYRMLTDEEIVKLLEQGCHCDDWSKITVADPFSVQRVRYVSFSGTVSLGLFDKTISFFGNIQRPSGIYQASIHECQIGDNVYIANIRNYIANYTIEKNVVIENVDLLATDGISCFGNGTEVSVLIEAGGRSVKIFDFLSSHCAYILACYRHRPRMIQKLHEMIDKYTDTVTSSRGSIKAYSRILNCRTIKNVKIGEHAIIEGIDYLENGSINSCADAPAFIGPGVRAQHFITSTGSRVSDGTIISHCFVGQGCVLAKQYSAENSLFFANSGGYHGEACSIFAGPYTVSHHKSTLLISGMFSFLNAGSGSNQSNHMYKLGPIHQGIVERGSKTASDSYILWPAKVGPFTLIYGRHYRNSDTSNLPYSYLIESEDESILVPGVNLRSVGTIRDASKWPKRDNRTDPNLLDHINFNLLSPFTIQKMLNGYEILKRLKENSGETTEYYTYNNVKIKNSSLKNGMEFYRMGINKFLGNSLIKRLEGQQCESDETIRACLTPDTPIGKGRWIDLSGLFAPEEIVEKLCNDIEVGCIANLSQVSDAFKSMHNNFYAYSWSWAIDIIQKRLNKTIDQLCASDIITLTQQWKESVLKLDELLLADAAKEYDLNSQISFGIDGDGSVRQLDFEQVRGVFDENDQVQVINKHMDKKSALAEELISRMKQCIGCEIK